MHCTEFNETLDDKTTMSVIQLLAVFMCVSSQSPFDFLQPK